jgi:hypothetical protein
MNTKIQIKAFIIATVLTFFISLSIIFFLSIVINNKSPIKENNEKIIKKNYNTRKNEINNDKIIKNKNIKRTFSLEVISTPKDTKVRILNIKEKYKFGIKLKKGKYYIEVSKRGYLKIKKWIEIKNKNIRLKVKLKKKKKLI